MKEEEGALIQALRHLPACEHAAWLSEVQRLSQLVAQYAALHPKRTWQAATQQYEYVPAVQELCQAARCNNPVIIAREPHRAAVPSPHSLERWARAYHRVGAVALLRQRPVERPADDQRQARMSPAAAQWLEAHWRQVQSPRYLYREWGKVAAEQGWTIPSEAWLYRRWQQIPAVVKTVQHRGWQAWEARYAPYVPRDYSDLQACQILCGDHSERDVLVNDGGKLRRPWLTLWQDLRTGLIWGWYLGRVPCGESVGLAYADGLLKYGAQPVARPTENFFSYIYTDWGRDYRSHAWDGQVIAVHQAAKEPTGGLELFLTEKRVGILAELMIRHLTARRYNAKEKPVERVFRDLSEWEKNSFAEYCGANASQRPEKLRQLVAEHQAYEKGQRSASPCVTWAEYASALEGYLKAWNERPHERTSLAEASAMVPQEEFERCYQPRYKLAAETIALLLLKATARVLRKNGVNCFQRQWFYWHEAMSAYKGQKNVKVEVRYTERDYRRVWVVLPQGELCEAELITPTSLLQPNKDTLRQVAQARAQEKKLVKDFQFLATAQWRGETTEERVTQRLAEQAREASVPPTTAPPPGTTIYQWTRFETLRAVPPSAAPSTAVLLELSGEEETRPCFRPLRRRVIEEVEDD